MSLYYRLTDARVMELDPAWVAQLSQPKRDTLRLYVEDAKPVPLSTQVVQDGPVLITATEARKTWLLVAKSAAQLAMEQFVAKRETDYAQVRSVYVALKNGTGTAAERLVRLEKVACRLIIDALGSEPA